MVSPLGYALQTPPRLWFVGLQKSHPPVERYVFLFTEVSAQSDTNLRPRPPKCS